MRTFGSCSDRLVCVSGSCALSRVLQTMIVSQYRTVGCKHNASRLCFARLHCFSGWPKYHIMEGVYLFQQVISYFSMMSSVVHSSILLRQIRGSVWVVQFKHIYLHNRYQWSWFIHSRSILSYSEYRCFSLSLSRLMSVSCSIVSLQSPAAFRYISVKCKWFMLYKVSMSWDLFS